MTALTKHVRTVVSVYKQNDAVGDGWKAIRMLEHLRSRRGPRVYATCSAVASHENDEFCGAGESNLECAILAEEVGRIGWASEVFSCSGATPEIW